MRFKRLLLVGSMSVASSVFAVENRSDGPKIYPAAMSMDYNPLLWEGHDAKFALDMLHTSHCMAEASKAVAEQTRNPTIQTAAVAVAREQEKLYRQLRNMARTFNFPLPHKRDLDDCPAASRIKELSGQQMDSSYITLLLKTTALNVSRFEAELARPRLPSNWSLWKLTEKDFPMIRGEESAIKGIGKQLNDK